MTSFIPLLFSLCLRCGDGSGGGAGVRAGGGGRRLGRYRRGARGGCGRRPRRSGASRCRSI